jgi:hypothetical protein
VATEFRSVSEENSTAAPFRAPPGTGAVSTGRSSGFTFGAVPSSEASSATAASQFGGAAPPSASSFDWSGSKFGVLTAPAASQFGGFDWSSSTFCGPSSAAVPSHSKRRWGCLWLLLLVVPVAVGVESIAGLVSVSEAAPATAATEFPFGASPGVGPGVLFGPALSSDASGDAHEAPAPGGPTGPSGGGRTASPRDGSAVAHLLSLQKQQANMLAQQTANLERFPPSAGLMLVQAKLADTLLGQTLNLARVITLVEGSRTGDVPIGDQGTYLGFLDIQEVLNHICISNANVVSRLYLLILGLQGDHDLANGREQRGHPFSDESKQGRFL